MDSRKILIDESLLVALYVGKNNSVAGATGAYNAQRDKDRYPEIQMQTARNRLISLGQHSPGKRGPRRLDDPAKPVRNAVKAVVTEAVEAVKTPKIELSLRAEDTFMDLRSSLMKSVSGLIRIAFEQGYAVGKADHDAYISGGPTLPEISLATEVGMTVSDTIVIPEVEAATPEVEEASSEVAAPVATEITADSVNVEEARATVIPTPENQEDEQSRVDDEEAFDDDGYDDDDEWELEESASNVVHTLPMIETV